MKSSKRKSSTNLDPLFLNKGEGSEFSSRLPSVHSQPDHSIKGSESSHKIYSSDINLTVRVKVKEFTRKQCTVLVGQLLRMVAIEGISIMDWMTLEVLYTYLLGNKQVYFERKDSKEFELLLLLKVVLSSVGWMDLSNKKQFPKDVQDAILSSKWVPNERTFNSRTQSFSLDKFISIRTVPVNFLYERSKDSIRYSSYCKGYGESGLTGRRKKTRPSSELDGEPVDLEKERSINLSFERFQQIQNLLSLEIKYTPKK